MKPEIGFFGEDLQPNEIVGEYIKTASWDYELILAERRAHEVGVNYVARK